MKTLNKNIKSLNIKFFGKKDINIKRKKISIFID